MRADKIFKNYMEFDDWVVSCMESNDLDFWDYPDFPKDCMHLDECECGFMYLVDPISNKTFKISGRYIDHHHTPGYDFENSYIEEIECKTLKEYFNMWLDQTNDHVDFDIIKVPGRRKERQFDVRVTYENETSQYTTEHINLNSDDHIVISGVFYKEFENQVGKFVRSIELKRGMDNKWISERYNIPKFQELYENLKDLYNFQSFDYDTMPEISRKKAHEMLMEWISEQFDLINDKDQ